MTSSAVHRQSTNSAQLPAVDLIDRLQLEIERILRPLLPTSGRYAFVDFPNHNNVGDSAMYVGSMRFLRQVVGKEPAYVSTKDNHSKERMGRLISDGTIFIQGGGNFGDIWPQHQYFREKLLIDFPDVPIIQLPQSVKFNDPAALERTKRVVSRHRNFVLLVRDSESLRIARKEFSCRSYLCPDMAFCLGPLEKPASPRYPIAYLLRTDLEAGDFRSDLSSLPQPDSVFDWTSERPGVIARLGARFLWESNRLDFSYSYHPRIYDYLAEARLKLGCRLLSRGQTIVTDRLHGHILCLLLGIPHAVLDNNYGKVSNFHKAWTYDFPSVRAATSLEEATRWAQQQHSAGC